jgi:hypothetical protein
MKRVILMALLAVNAGATPPPEPPQSYDQLEERDPTGSFVVGNATADEVKAKLGAPLAENHNRDGRFVYTYLSPTNDYISYLFDKTGVLIRVRSAAKAD